MPPINEHVKLSLKRTGKGYREIHEWMDGKDISYKERIARHKVTNVPEFLPIIEKKFGKDGAKEYLWHIEEDYEQNTSTLVKIWRKLRGFCRKLILP